MRDFFTLKEVLRIIPVKRACWYRYVQSGLFPAPVKRGSSALYRKEDIAELVRRIAEGKFDGSN